MKFRNFSGDLRFYGVPLRVALYAVRGTLLPSLTRFAAPKFIFVYSSSIPSNMVILETPRLALREFCSEDAGHLYLLNLDPDVIRYTGDLAFESTEAAADFVRQYDHYQKYGFGRWAVTDRKNGAFLGWCGLKFCPDTNEHDIGFRFFKKYWNRGYATEAAKACLDHGFNELGLTQIVGRAAIANRASVKVLQKIGMAYLRSMDCGQDPGVVYQIENPTAN